MSELPFPHDAPQQGIYYGISDEAYFALPYLSASVLKAGTKCMLHAKYALRESVKETKALRIGSMVDCGLFYGLPELFNRFAVQPDIDRRTKVGKAEYAEWKASVDAAGARVVSDVEMAEATKYVTRALEDKDLAAIIGAAGEAQAVCVWMDPTVGMWCKCKLDRFVPGKIALELKTTTDSSPFGFAREATKHKYIYQFAWYWHGLQVVTGQRTPFVVAAIEKNGYCPVSIYTVPDEYLQRALTECKRLAATIGECVKSGEWTGYQRGVTPLELPAYAFDTSYVPYVSEEEQNDEHPF